MSVYEKTLNILQKILLSLTGIYPLDLSAFNESEYKTAEFSLYFYKKIGESKSSSFEIKWHESSILEREYANFWVKRTLISVIDLIEKTVLNSIKEKKFTNLEDNFSEIIDVVNLSIKEPIQSLKQDFLRLLMMIEQVYGAIMMRCEQKTAVKDENYEGFKKNFLFDEFSELNMRLLELLEKIFMYLIDSELIIDVQIMGIYVRIIAQILGEDQ